MRNLISVPIAVVLLSGCAEERLLTQTNSYYQGITSLPEQEIVNNIDATIDNPYRIPTRTTFGKGNLTFTDNAQATISVPLHLFSSTAGSAGGNAGAFTDSYQLAIDPETRSVVLAALRDLYRALVDSRFKSKTPIPRGGHWLFWTNLDGTPSKHEPPANAFSIGRGLRHELFVDDAEAYYDFVLLTYGYVTSTRRDQTVADQGVKQPNKTRPGVPPARTPSTEKPSAGGSSGQPTQAAPREGVPDERIKPSFAPPSREISPAPPTILERREPTDNPSALPVPRN